MLTDTLKLNLQTLQAIEGKVTAGGLEIDPVAIEDLWYMSREIYDMDRKTAVNYGRKASQYCARYLKDADMDGITANRVYKFHEELLKILAVDDFESYLLFTEWNREPERKFYPPRTIGLRNVVRNLQRLHDDELDMLSISLPPGVGKTTLALFYLSWLGGIDPEGAILMFSHSNTLVEGTYAELLRMLDKNGEYRWHEVFPNVEITNTNAKALRVNLGYEKRFDTFQFTSVGAGSAGLYRAQKLLYCDDLIPNREFALSRERLDKLWNTFTTDIRQRKLGDRCKELHIATKWSLHDVIGRLQEEHRGSDRAEFIVYPALDEETDESNFNYAYGVGHSTEALHRQRDTMDPYEWDALYQGKPREREGQLYNIDELRTACSLPEGEPDAILGVCDTKTRGTDYCFLPVGYGYGDDYYIWDCVCDNGQPPIVNAEIVECLIKNKVQICQFESNSAGTVIADNIAEALRNRGGITDIRQKFTQANKETKIIVNSPWVKQHCIFKDGSLYAPNSAYGKMMHFLTSYTLVGKNKNDDVPDGLAMFAMFVQNLLVHNVMVVPRPF